MGYIPDWQRQSAAKNQPQAQTKSPTKFGVVSKPIFHAEKALHSQGTQTPFTRHYADASEGGVGSETDTANQTDSRNVFQKMGDSISKYAAEGREKVQAQAAADGYDKTDKGLLGGTINYREDADGRKYVQKKDPMSGRMEEQRYYSGDDVKNGFKSLFGGNNAPETLKAKTVSSTDSQESAGNMGSPAKTAMQSSNDSYTPPKPGVFSNVDAAVKSATKVGDDTSITSTTDYSTKTRSNSASRVTTKARQDVPGSSAKSYPLDTSDRPSKPYPINSSSNDDRPSRSAPLPDYAKEASDAGSRFVALTAHVKNLPAGTSPEDRAKAGQLMRDAQTDYETKSARARSR